MRQPRHVGFGRKAWLAACLVVVVGVAIACLVAALGLTTAPATVAAQGNPIVVENQQPGTNAWDILNANGLIATDSGGQIKGYASANSVNKGESIAFKVSVKPAQTFTIDVYRIGWYGGLGGRLMQHIGPLNGTTQATCPRNATTGLIECNWTDSYVLATQSTWTSGIYLAVLKNAAQYQNFVIFAVRDDFRVAPLVYQQPVTTYQAYNAFPNDNLNGKSLYDFNSFGPTTIGGTKGAVKVSFDRPYMDNGAGGDFFAWEINFIRWMEKSGYDVTYTTNIETHTDGARLLNYRGFISSGHDEYWSKAMYDAAIAARDAGVHLGFFGADNVYTQIRFEPSSTGAPNRVIVCYREAALDPITDPALETVNFRDAPVNRPEQRLLGVQFLSQVEWSNGFFKNYIVSNAGHWVYAGSGFTNGESVRGLVGYEADTYFPNFPAPDAVPGTFVLLSNSPYSAGTANSSIYQATSGAWVFSAGTIQWSWGLDSYGNGWNIVNSKLQIATANIFNRFINAQPPPTVTSVTPASGPTTGGTPITISGTNFVAGASVTLGAAAAASVTVVNATTITAVTPAHAVGAVSVTVINPDGLSGTRANGFTYISTAPTVNTVSPGSGPIAGGTAITVTGTNYAAGATVTLGGTPATAVNVVNSTTITAITPAHAFGSVTVVVTNTDSQSGSKANAFTYLAPAPTLSSVAPAGGATTGGTALTLTGTNFLSGATVSVGGAAATGVTVVNSTTITATTPAHSSGLVGVTVTNPDSQSATLNNSFTYSSPFPAPTVTGVAPGSGTTNGGTAVTISGTGFMAGAAVSIGGAAATAVTVVNATTITATTPSHVAGAVSVVVTNTDGQSGTQVNGFTYVAPPGVIFDAVGPSAGGISVSSGSSLTWNHTVTTTASNLLLTVAVAVGKHPDAGMSLAVTYNGVAMTSAGRVHSNNEDSGFVDLFYLKAPATGTRAVQVTLTGGPASMEAGSVSFSGVDQTTPVRNITAASGSGTTPTVTLASGPGNMVVDAMVTGCPGSITSSKTLRWLNELDCATAGGNGAQSTAAGAASVTMGYTVPSDWWGIIAMDILAAPSAPTFDFTLSNTGNKTVVRGSSVPNTITATLSTGTTQAATFSASGAPSGVTPTFDTASCSPTCTTTLTLAANAAAALGTSSITVTAVGGSVTRTTSFNLTVNAPPPTVTGISPASGSTAGGTAVTVTGTNFLAGATVSIGGTPATGVTVVNATTITATTAAHGAGLAGVTVTNPDSQSATLANAFTYVAPPPTISSVSPTSGAAGGGTLMTISGTGFAAGATVTVGGTAATNVTVVNSTTITATTPAHAVGAVSVTVTNADTQSATSVNAFTYLGPPPTVSAVAPASGPATGGTSVTITGTNFAAGASVAIGGTSATGVTIVNATTITATTPAHAVGQVAVTVANTDGQSGTLAAAFTFLGPQPTVTGIAPSSGSTGGGTAVTISGSNFVSGATVSIGGTAATGVTVVNGTTITATAPAHAAGAVGVTVTNPDSQSSTLASSFTYVVPPPTVSGVSPVSGSTNGGTAVTITGTGFAAGATVTIGGTAATSVTVVNSTSITAATPAHAAGAVSVTVTNADSQSGTAANAFTYVAPAPTVASVAPVSGPIAGGTAVTITGTNFAAGASVTIGGVSATGVSVVNSTTITATTPAHAAGAVNVTVTNADSQSATLTNGFTYLAPAPEVTSVAPTSGSTGGGTAITISGSNFLAGATVTVGGTAATAVTVVNSSTITAATPAHAAGAVGVTVTNPDSQSSTLAGSFTYVVPPPTVSGVSPVSGSTNGGTAVTITGTGFAAGATVTIGGTAATGVTVVNSTSITATTPAHAAGAVSVTVTNADSQSGTAANAFTYMAPPPTLASVAPVSGPIAGGTAVTVTGTNFAAGASVTIGGVSATGVSVVNSTTITATTPAHAAGAVNVTVTNADSQSATLTNGFTYLAPAPEVTSVAPTSGSTGGGTAITISGANFLAGATVSIGGTAATGVTVVNSSTITATTPAHAAGAVDVTVINPDSQSSSLASSFTYVVPPPTVSGVSPVSGSTNGGTAVTITGTGFAAGATVTIGGTAATGVTVVNSTSITATTPAHAAGAVSVTVTNADSQSGTAANAFTYVAPPPTLASVAPVSGPIAGGTAVTITGTNFAAGASVTIGGVPATGVSVVNSTTITATTPAHAAGAVNVTVTNADSQSATLTNGFTYLAPPPIVAGITPASGSTGGGTAITISGSNFLPGATVTLDGTAATGVTVVNSTTITATTPAHIAGAVDVTVANADSQSSTLGGAYTYVVPVGVAVDSVAPGPVGAGISSGSTLSWNHTVSATGSDRLLTVGVTVGRNNDKPLLLSVRYAGVLMTSAGIVHSNNRTAGFVQLFYMVAPPTGTNQVQVTMTGGSGSIEAGSVSFTGVNQTTPIRNVTTAFGNSATPSVTVASAPGNMVVDALAAGCNGVITSTQTLRWLKTINCANGGGNGAQATAQGAASVTMGYNVPADWWGIIAMDLIAK